MSRQERRAVASELRKRAASWPEKLTPVDPSEWPPRREGQAEYPYAVWRSKRYLVQLYECKERFDGQRVVRLSVNYSTVGADGGWGQGMSWDELQAIKYDVGFGDRYAIEVYPRDWDVVNVANMRHLWILVKPLPIGWFA